MKRNDILGAIIIMIMLFSIGFMTWLLKQDIKVNQATSTETNKSTKTIECQHEFVTVSKYSYLRKCYKNYSRCWKCGKEVK